MEKPIPFFYKKIIKKKSLKPQDINKKHKKNTKAELKKEFLTHCHNAVEHIKIFNRIPMVNEKMNHLNTAITHLEKCLIHRPGNHILRNQIKLCREELILLKKSNKRSANNVIEILFSTNLFNT
ncbi:MAG: hypothetical protein ACE5KZ_04085 [Candidatus Scalinduaceae bacterium]